MIEKLGLAPGMKILDLCCGQGRHLLELMRRGYEVVGVDLSAYMLGLCREAAAAEGITPDLHRRDMRAIDFNAEFDAVIMMLTSFGYLESDEEDQKVLHGIAKALKPGGKVLLDLMNPIMMVKRYAPRDWLTNVRGEITVRERHYDPLTGRMHGAETTFLLDGSKDRREHLVRLYTCPEITRMLSVAGLTLEYVFGGYDGSAYTADANKMIVLATNGGSGI